jgi:hypothetical protein
MGEGGVPSAMIRVAGRVPSATALMRNLLRDDDIAIHLPFCTNRRLEMIRAKEMSCGHEWVRSGRLRASFRCAGC